MCNFFSLVSDGCGRIMYFDWDLRLKCISGELDYNPDSHTSIADYFGYEGAINKYEYNPLTKVFTVDQINNPIDDRKEVEEFCHQLDFQSICPYLVIKPIINPFEIAPPSKITDDILGLLAEWDSVRDSVRDSVWDSVWASVGASVRDSVWYSVIDSVGDSVGDSVWASMWASVRDSVWDSVIDSVWASVGAYIGSFFNLPEWEAGYKFNPAVELWQIGLVPSFDGKIWRIHGGKEGNILWEGRP